MGQRRSMRTVKLVRAARVIEVRLDTMSHFIGGTHTLAGTGLQLEAVRGRVSQPSGTSLQIVNVSQMPTMRVLRDVYF